MQDTVSWMRPTDQMRHAHMCVPSHGLQVRLGEHDSFATVPQYCCTDKLLSDFADWEAMEVCTLACEASLLWDSNV